MYKKSEVLLFFLHIIKTNKYFHVYEKKISPYDFSDY